MTTNKLIRITTVPVSLRGLLKGQLKYMSQHGFDVLGVSSSGKALDDVAKNEGVRVEAVEMTRTMSPMKGFEIVSDIKSVDDIPSEASGKFRIVKNNVKGLVE